MRNGSEAHNHITVDLNTLPIDAHGLSFSYAHVKIIAGTKLSIKKKHKVYELLL